MSDYVPDAESKPVDGGIAGQDQAPWPWPRTVSASKWETIANGMKADVAARRRSVTGEKVPLLNREAVELARIFGQASGGKAGQLAWWQWALPAYGFDPPSTDLVVTARQAAAVYDPELTDALWQWVLWSARTADAAGSSSSYTVYPDSSTFFSRTTIAAVTDAANRDIGSKGAITPLPQLPRDWADRYLKPVLPLIPIYTDPFGVRRLGDFVMLVGLIWLGVTILGNRTVFDD